MIFKFPAVTAFFKLWRGDKRHKSTFKFLPLSSSSWESLPVKLKESFFYMPKNVKASNILFVSPIHDETMKESAPINQLIRFVYCLIWARGAVFVLLDTSINRAVLLFMNKLRTFDFWNFFMYMLRIFNIFQYQLHAETLEYTNNSFLMYYFVLY